MGNTKEILNNKINQIKIDSKNKILYIDDLSITQQEFFNLDFETKDQIISSIVKNSEHIGSKFEPINNLLTLEVEKYEVLLSFSDDLDSFLTDKSINRFTGDINVIINDAKSKSGTMVTRKHFQNIKRLEKTNKINKNISYAVNFNERDIECPKIMNFFEKNLDLTKKIEIELLESIPNDYLKTENTQKIINKFSLLSARLKIDDYGAGENNIERILLLKKLYPEMFKSVKLDKEFIEYLNTDHISLQNVKQSEIKNFGKLFYKKSYDPKIFSIESKDKIFLKEEDRKNYNTENSFNENKKIDMILEVYRSKIAFLKKGTSKEELLKGIQSVFENKDNINKKEYRENFNKLMLEFINMKRKSVLEEMDEVSNLALINNLSIVCEYVENAEILSHLKTRFNNINSGQGYLFSDQKKNQIEMVEGKGINLINMKPEINNKHIETILIRDIEIRNQIEINLPIEIEKILTVFYEESKRERLKFAFFRTDLEMKAPPLLTLKNSKKLNTLYSGVMNTMTTSLSDCKGIKIPTDFNLREEVIKAITSSLDITESWKHNRNKSFDKDFKEHYSNESAFSPYMDMDMKMKIS